MGCLADLEKRSQAKIRDSVDFFAGTSIGGIVALALAADISVDKIAAAFERHGPRLFTRRRKPGPIANVWRLARNIFAAPYSNEILKELINELVGDDRRLGDLDRYVLIPAFNLRTGSIVWFRNYNPKCPDEPNYEFADAKVTDIALATSAAPTYFRPHDFKIYSRSTEAQASHDAGDYVDGGVFANCPDLRAHHEAVSVLQCKESIVNILALGTTTENIAEPTHNVRHWGLYYWLTNHRLTDVLMAAQQQNVVSILRERMNERYVRIDGEPAEAQLAYMGLDIAGAGAEETIHDLATATMQKIWNTDGQNADLQESLQNFGSSGNRVGDFGGS